MIELKTFRWYLDLGYPDDNSGSEYGTSADSNRGAINKKTEIVMIVGGYYVTSDNFVNS